MAGYNWGAKCSFESLAAYWGDRFGCSIPPMQCVACHTDGWLDRAHIVPKYKGGKNRQDNAIPLCKRCHSTSEGKDPDQIVEWARQCRINGKLIVPPWVQPKTELEQALFEALCDAGLGKEAERVVGETWLAARRVKSWE